MLESVSRTRAFVVHLGISLVIFVVLAAVMLLNWFPGPFFASDGGWQGIRIVAAVDVVLGPALTLIFFNSRKKKHRELLLDLSAIAVVQIAALAWGTWTVYDQRTVAITFTGSGFFSISHGTLSEANQALATAGIETRDIDAFSETHPRQIYVRPLSPGETGQYLADVFNGLPELQVRTDRYLPLHEHWEAVLDHAIDVRQYAADKPRLAARLETHPPNDALVYFPLKLRFGLAVVGFDRETRNLATITTYR